MTTVTRPRPTPAKRPEAKPKVKTIEDPIRFLLDNGLLFYINHRSLHPLGLGLTVKEDRATGKMVIDQLIDKREMPDNEFSRDDFDAGSGKLAKCLATWGRAVMSLRRKIKGWTTQPLPE